MVSERNRWPRALIPTPAAMLRVSLLAVILASGTGCATGHGLKYTVDDALLQPLPAADQQGVLDARREAALAAAEREAANRSLQQVDREMDMASREKDRAELETEKVVAEQEGASASGDRNQADMAAHHKEVADMGVNVSKLKLDWLHEKRDWLEKIRAAADAHLEAARARLELEKSRAARDHDLKPSPEGTPLNFEDQWHDRDARWGEKKRSATAAEQEVLLKQAKWREEERQFQELQGS